MMLIRFFRSTFLIHYIAYILVGIVLWINAFISPLPVRPPEPEYTPLYELLYSLLANVPLVATLIAFMIVLVEGIMLNMILAEHDVVPRNSFQPGLFYLVFMSANPEGLTLYPALAASVLFIPLMHILFGLYLKEDTLKEYLTAGMLAGLSTLLYVQSIVMVPVIIMSLIIYRNAQWRSWVSSLAGFLLVLLYAMVYYFWTDSLGMAFSSWEHYFKGFFRFDAGHDNFTLAIYGGMLLLFTFPAVARSMLMMNTHRIALRRLLSLTLWTLVLTTIFFFTRGDDLLHSLVWLPAVVMITKNLTSMRKIFFQEILFLALILSIAYHNFVH